MCSELSEREAVGRLSSQQGQLRRAQGWVRRGQQAPSDEAGVPEAAAAVGGVGEESQLQVALGGWYPVTRKVWALVFLVLTSASPVISQRTGPYLTSEDLISVPIWEGP